MSGLIVVGVDGSTDSQRALRWAAQEARTRGARLKVVLVWSYLDQEPAGFDPAYGEQAARRSLDAAVAALGAESAGVDLEPVLVCDLPARGLLDAARGADLVVVGSRGLGGFTGLLLGSVSQQVTQHAPCPVVVVPGDGQGEATGGHQGA